MWGVIISLGASAVSAFVSMILSSISAEAASSGDSKRAHTYARASALVNGFTVFLLILAILFVYFQKPIAAKLSDQVQSLQNILTQASKSQ